MEILRWMGIADRYKRMYLDRQLAPLGINSSQHMYILKVCREPGITQDQFLESFSVHPSNVTRAVAALEKSGFLRREQYEEDKRTCRLYPTEKSLEIFDRIRQISRETEAEMTAGFSQEEVRQLDALLRRAAENMYSGLYPGEETFWEKRREEGNGK